MIVTFHVRKRRYCADRPFPSRCRESKTFENSNPIGLPHFPTHPSGFLSENLK